MDRKQIPEPEPQSKFQPEPEPEPEPLAKGHQLKKAEKKRLKKLRKKKKEESEQARQKDWQNWNPMGYTPPEPKSAIESSSDEETEEEKNIRIATALSLIEQKQREASLANDALKNLIKEHSNALDNLCPLLKDKLFEVSNALYNNSS
jgi:hypothetical protein